MFPITKEVETQMKEEVGGRTKIPSITCFYYKFQVQHMLIARPSRQNLRAQGLSRKSQCL